MLTRRLSSSVFIVAMYKLCDVQSITAILKVSEIRETFLCFVSALIIKFIRFTLYVIRFISLLHWENFTKRQMFEYIRHVPLWNKI